MSSPYDTPHAAGGNGSRKETSTPSAQDFADMARGRAAREEEEAKAKAEKQEADRSDRDTRQAKATVREMLLAQEEADDAGWKAFATVMGVGGALLVNVAVVAAVVAAREALRKRAHPPTDIG